MTNCDEMPDEEWQRQRFSDRCYFYPGRDCPGWRIGTICARIRKEIKDNGGYDGSEK